MQMYSNKAKETVNKMTTPRQFENKMLDAVENGDNNIDIIIKCVGVMTETLDSLGYHAGTEILKRYMDDAKCK